MCLSVYKYVRERKSVGERVYSSVRDRKRERLCVKRYVFVSEVEESLALKDLQLPHENRNGNGQEERERER